MGSTTKPLRVARYVRCSRAEQNVNLQLDETAALIEKRGWTLVETYKDVGVSGTRERRPALDKLMADVSVVADMEPREFAERI